MTDQIEDQDVELDEEIEEAHDPKNAEQQSFAANDKAEAAGKKAKGRKGDKSNSEPMQKAPAAPAAMKAEDVEFDGDFSEDLNALVESEATLSDEFKAKTAVIFEAAVKSKLSEEIDRLETEYQAQLDEEIQSTKTDLVEKVDSYLNYVVENWMEENKLAIQSGLRAEIAEGFMDKLKDVFTESYIEVPESKVDLVDELSETVEELEEKLNESTGKSIEMAEELELLKRERIILEASNDLTDTQSEKLTKLVADIDYDDDDTFIEKVVTVRESYFSKKAVNGSTNIDEVEEDDNIVETTGSMGAYLTAIKRQNK